MSLVYLLLPQLVAFREAGYDVCGVSAPGPHIATLEEHGIAHVALRGSTRSADLRADLTAARHFARLCRTARPDIVHTHNPKPGVYGRIGARLRGVPVVVNTVHGLYAQPNDPLAKRTAVYAMERIAATCSGAELVQNPEDLATLERLGVPRHKLHLLGNGVDLARFDPDVHAEAGRVARHELGIADDEVVVGLVGRLVAEKGYREVFAAAEDLRRACPKARLLVIGPSEPDKTDAIQPHELERAERLGVRLLGARGDIESLYPAMDLYVLASHREGFPRSAMEAAAMGLPLILTDIRGCRQVVDDGVNGHRVPVGDARALARSIEKLVNDPAERQRMGAASRVKAAAEFDDSRQIALTLQVYERLLDRRGSARPDELTRRRPR